MRTSNGKPDSEAKPLVLRCVHHRPARPSGRADRGFRAVGAILSRHAVILSPHRGGVMMEP